MTITGDLVKLVHFRTFHPPGLTSGGYWGGACLWVCGCEPLGQGDVPLGRGGHILPDTHTHMDTPWTSPSDTPSGCPPGHHSTHILLDTLIPWTDTPLWTHPSGHLPTVNKRAVRILLECFLVSQIMEIMPIV